MKMVRWIKPKRLKAICAIKSVQSLACQPVKIWKAVATARLPKRTALTPAMTYRYPMMCQTKRTTINTFKRFWNPPKWGVSWAGWIPISARIYKNLGWIRCMSLLVFCSGMNRRLRTSRFLHRYYYCSWKLKKSNRARVIFIKLAPRGKSPKSTCLYPSFCKRILALSCPNLVKTTRQKNIWKRLPVKLKSLKQNDGASADLSLWGGYVLLGWWCFTIWVKINGQRTRALPPIISCNICLQEPKMNLAVVTLRITILIRQRWNPPFPCWLPMPMRPSIALWLMLCRVKTRQ